MLIANGLIRGRYVPKGSSEKDFSPYQQQTFIKRINHTPRKYLNYLTPMESFFRFLHPLFFLFT
ncbi:MAG: hypothetical protein COZ46_04120 [Verrucomicrobia bacterium CG_4_10_14_3_um_filter_43_23]|nr:MAG: hypothetical protein AUJ82_07465 [Verrucomicrobia bacterium CG1_02_43_26]PIX58370.1 MAG: hypothetical protein COZ46_04120 [Verrucomicrobia bacterium CG_4_10_14_3_um_filter_43_23]PIY61208.1 MAG: hypothetical protein COY94_06340 [Verrucomicrobia bacterium CG_4_10_14_0_8_um_filter_43_34]